MCMKCFVCGWTTCMKTQNLKGSKVNINSSLIVLNSIAKSLSCVFISCDENHGVHIFQSFIICNIVTKEIIFLIMMW
jgi:hypothetical protein